MFPRAPTIDANRTAMLWHCGIVVAMALTAIPATAGTQAPVTIEVRGDDFPVLVQQTGLPPPLDDNGLPQPAGCEAIRARRLDELPYPWSEAVDRVHLDCQPAESVEAGIALTVTAFLKAGRVWLAGQPVREIRLMDSYLYGDHQYVIAADFAQVGAELREQVEADCQRRHLLEERDDAAVCQMLEQPGEFYLKVDEISGIWIHADADDAGSTIYSEAWAD